MAVEQRPLIEVSQEAIRLLYRELGIVDTVRFLNQFNGGFGDYTEERRGLFANLSLEDVVAAIKADKSAQRPASTDEEP